jgi:hypothetical protein
MGRLDDIQALVGESRRQLSEIEKRYGEGLNAKQIPSGLGVLVKNYLENLRSSLDYVASETWSTALRSTKPRGVYFPINTMSAAEFAARMKKDFPELETKAPALYAVFAKLQAFEKDGCHSFPKLNSLVNDNKHDQLSPQSRTEARSLEVRFGGGASIQVPPGASISGHGTISSGGGWIQLSGGTVSGSNPATAGGGPVQQFVTIWVSFTFTSTGDEVVNLLKACMNDVQRVIENVKPHLWP